MWRSFRLDSFIPRSMLKNDNKQKIKSECRNIDIGIPQGSVLGPVLFLLCMNELYLSLMVHFFVVYADGLIASDAADEQLELHLLIHG